MDIKTKVWELLISNVPTIAYAIALGIGVTVSLTKALRFTYDAIKGKHDSEINVLKLTHELSQLEMRASMEDRIERLFEKNAATVTKQISEVMQKFSDVEKKIDELKVNDKEHSTLLNSLNREVGELNASKSKGGRLKSV